jgi:predicted ATPase
MVDTVYPEVSPEIMHFHERITTLLRAAGRKQLELAKALPLDPHVLGRKLNGTRQITQQEIRQIILTLAVWGAITTQAEARELLFLVRMRLESFSPEEWNKPPLNELKPLPLQSKSIATGSTNSFPLVVPIPTTSFVERTDLENLIGTQLRQADIRLLTLLGAAGIGKTRLSLQIGQKLAADFSDGVYFIALESVQEPELVPSAIAQIFGLANLGMEVFSGEVLLSYEEQLKAFLRPKNLLLILDNFEHLPDAAPFIGQLLGAAAHLKILVTSRSVLHIYGEHLITVQPLPVYGPDQQKDPGQLRSSPAIRLFAERAQAVNPQFKLTKSNLPTLASLCTHLDGLPLAIELVAARSHQFSLNALLKRLEQEDAEGQESTLAFLRQRKGTVPARQQTLERALDWSYQLLTPPMQRLFARMGIFLGGWTLDAAQAISPPGDDSLDSDALWDQMEKLVSQSMAVAEPEESQPNGSAFPRFRLLEVIRRYALDHLHASGEYEEVARLHAFYYLQLAERTERDLLSDRRQLAIQMLARDRDNFRAALQWALAHGEADLAQRLCSILELYWEALSQLQEAHRWMDAALAMEQPTSPLVRAKLDLAISWLYLWEIACERSRQFAEEGLQLYIACDDIDGQAKAIFQLGESYHFQGEYAQAIFYFEKSLQMERDLGNTRESAFSRSRLGAIAMLQGDLDRAEAFLIEASSQLRELGEFARLGATLGILGIVHILQADFVRALTVLREGVLLSAEVGPPYALALNWTIIGCALGGSLAPEYAARICSAASALLTRLGTSLPTSYQPLYEFYIAGVRSPVDEATWQTWWQEGPKLTKSETIALALEGCTRFFAEQKA